MAGKFLIAGLGNIGAEYELTRHNIGFMGLDFLAEESGICFSTDRLGAIAELKYRGNTLVLLKPSTYMNLSGRAVSYWLQAEKIAPENLLVVCDDLALPFNTLRMRKRGSSGGHNGLENISQVLGNSDYARLRVGIGSEFSRGAQIDYVLGRFEDEHLKQMPELLKRACQAIKDFVFLGADRAMNICNTKATPAPKSEKGQSPSSEAPSPHSEQKEESKTEGV